MKIFLILNGKYIIAIACIHFNWLYIYYKKYASPYLKVLLFVRFTAQLFHSKDGSIT